MTPKRGAAVAAFECKASVTGFDPTGIAAFRRHHPTGTNYLVCLDAMRRSVRSIKGLEIEVVPYSSVGDVLDAM